MFCEYAKEFVASMQKVGGEKDHEESVSIFRQHIELLGVKRSKWSWL